MPQLYGTASLRHLAQRRRLTLLAQQLPQPRADAERLLRSLATGRSGLPRAALGEANSCLLLQQHWTTTTAAAEALALPFVFVDAINLELSYGCNLACSHCLQAPLRPRGAATWLAVASVSSLLQQAQLLDLLSHGLNLTGGEVVAPASPVLELLELAQGLGIPTRMNSNAWWGHQRQIQEGQHCFADDAALVEALQQRGLGRLAMSLDARYSQYPQLLERVLRVASLCEAAGLAHEFVASAAAPELVAMVQRRLPRAMITPMQVVDLGAAQPRHQRRLRSSTLAALAHLSDCGTAGFSRPSLLHVSPDGGVRSCLYAPGAGWLGNLRQQSLIEILNAAATNRVVQLFAAGELDAFVADHLAPWQHLYRGIEHGCTAAALIARLAERLAQQRHGQDRSLLPEELEQLHRRLAAEMGLSAPTVRYVQQEG